MAPPIVFRPLRDWSIGSKNNNQSNLRHACTPLTVPCLNNKISFLAAALPITPCVNTSWKQLYSFNFPEMLWLEVVRIRSKDHPSIRRFQLGVTWQIGLSDRSRLQGQPKKSFCLLFNMLWRPYCQKKRSHSLAVIHDCSRSTWPGNFQSFKCLMAPIKYSPHIRLPCALCPTTKSSSFDVFAPEEINRKPIKTPQSALSTLERLLEMRVLVVCVSGRRRENESIWLERKAICGR